MGFGTYARIPFPAYANSSQPLGGSANCEYAVSSRYGQENVWSSVAVAVAAVRGPARPTHIWTAGAGVAMSSPAALVGAGAVTEGRD